MMALLQIFAKCILGRTPLHVAALEGRAQVAAVLIEGGAPVEAAMYAGPFRPLHLAAQEGHSNVAEVLLGAGGAEVDAQGPDSKGTKMAFVLS